MTSARLVFTGTFCLLFLPISLDLDAMFVLNEQAVENLNTRKWSTRALAVLVWEFALTFKDELRHIWSSLAFQRHAFPSLIPVAEDLQASVSTFTLSLVLWQMYQSTFLLIASCSLMAALDIILMLRVYALHRQNIRVGIFLVVLFFAQVTVELICGARSVLDVPFDLTCDTSETHHDVIYFSISVWIMHISLGALTVAKRSLVGLGAPVARLVTRDGAWALVIICAIFATVVPYSFLSQVSKAHVVFGWPISLFGIGCCRIIMNMQSLDITIGGDLESHESFTVDFEMNIIRRRHHPAVTPGTEM
ncbi:hypothetical protein B0H34DRAFT_808056 [Crassisporium funariophilum]|nr:hypothetical protein B0H34DRAFT_808056 [Crassisporium funariophilum]